ncbi:TMEM175 family protein [Mucilaginibacter sp. RS28]|uniref:TMEM175 family protein n=1 Tax=Mucilaginibacter straminoryzae TaxID=2932774 RepID=A0A9X1X4L8_9SPHI|nr:TMEM175 family protein [Mucilaginibacter straminoryzae]MCJ8209518.1 TMEM175 family protein [Mucilaginibacter straminoryzae]
MKKGRLEAFSDGVLAIIITIMVLELKVPHTADLGALVHLLPVFFSYLLSFVYVGIYWNNHHHMIYLVERINGAVLWANHNLLFWLSLIPFVTAWIGENSFSKWPVFCYGCILLICGISYYILARTLVKHTGENSALAVAIGKDYKGILSIILYTIGITVSYFNAVGGMVVYVLVALIWLVPDKRIERRLTHSETKG